MKFLHNKTSFMVLTLLLLTTIVITESIESSPHIEEHFIWDDEDPDKHTRYHQM